MSARKKQQDRIDKLFADARIAAGMARYVKAVRDDVTAETQAYFDEMVERERKRREENGR